MIELHTRIFCECGLRYYVLTTGDIPLPKNYEIVSRCPVEKGGCGKENRASYTFDAVFSCIQPVPWWKRLFVKPVQHGICNHFTKNEGNTDEETFPRRCSCGEEILLKQRRVQ